MPADQAARAHIRVHIRAPLGLSLIRQRIEPIVGRAGEPIPLQQRGDRRDPVFILRADDEIGSRVARAHTREPARVFICQHDAVRAAAVDVSAAVGAREAAHVHAAGDDAVLGVGAVCRAVGNNAAHITGVCGNTAHDAFLGKVARAYGSVGNAARAPAVAPHRAVFGAGIRHAAAAGTHDAAAIIVVVAAVVGSVVVRPVRHLRQRVVDIDVAHVAPVAIAHRAAEVIGVIARDRGAQIVDFAVVDFFAADRHRRMLVVEYAGYGAVRNAGDDIAVIPAVEDQIAGVRVRVLLICMPRHTADIDALELEARRLRRRFLLRAARRRSG